MNKRIKEIGRMKRAERRITRSRYCQIGPLVMQERMKEDLLDRVDTFFQEIVNREARTPSDWMKEFAVWSLSKTL